MPRLNRRGPNGDGPMTGRRMGRCNPDNKGQTDDEFLQNKVEPTKDQNNILIGRGLGRARGFGKGFGLGGGKGLRSRGNS